MTFYKVMAVVTGVNVSILIWTIIINVTSEKQIVHTHIQNPNCIDGRMK